jgi:predicted nucleic acid-binding protein
MRLVVDANVLFSFFKTDSVTRRLVISFEVLELHTPTFCLDELLEHEQEICEKCGISKPAFEEAFKSLGLFVRVVPDESFRVRAKEAAELLPEHPKGIPYLTLALELRCPIWSQDGRLKRQSRVRVLSTEEVLKLLSKTGP